MKVAFENLNYWVTQKLLQIYTANHATFPIRIRKITVQICGNFLVTQYIVYRYDFGSKLGYVYDYYPEITFVTIATD